MQTSACSLPENEGLLPWQLAGWGAVWFSNSAGAKTNLPDWHVSREDQPFIAACPVCSNIMHGLRAWQPP